MLRQINFTEVLRKYNHYYLLTGTFPTHKDLLYVPQGVSPPFVRTEDKISPTDLYKNILSKNMFGLVGIQFLAAFNIFMRGDPNLSKNVMSELLHNLSLQALRIDEDGIEIKFNQITDLCYCLRELFRSNNALTQCKEPRIYKSYTPPKFPPVKDRTEKFAEGVVELMVTDEKVDHP